MPCKCGCDNFVQDFWEFLKGHRNCTNCGHHKFLHGRSDEYHDN